MQNRSGKVTNVKLVWFMVSIFFVFLGGYALNERAQWQQISGRESEYKAEKLELEMSLTSDFEDRLRESEAVTALALTKMIETTENMKIVVENMRATRQADNSELNRLRAIVREHEQSHNQ